MIHFNSQSSIASVIASDRNLEPVFIRYGITNTSASISECSSSSEFVALILKCFAGIEQVSDKIFENFQIDIILDYLKRSHQIYLNKYIPELEQLIRELYWQESKRRFLFPELTDFYLPFKIHLEQHFSYEENFLFPYAEYLSDQKSFEERKEILNYSVKEFMKEHDDTETELMEIRSHLIKHQPLFSWSLPYRILQEKLKNFEADLRIHAHIEEVVLIPRLVSIEKSKRND